MEPWETCPHFLTLLRTSIFPLLTKWFDMVGWWTVTETLQSHWRGVRLMISGYFPQEGATMKNKVFIWHEWLGDYITGHTLHPHSNTCYTQSGPWLASAFLMWMYCSGWANLKWFREASWTLWAEIAPHTDIKALLRQALHGMFCQAVPFASSSHFLVLLQSLENANPF